MKTHPRSLYAGAVLAGVLGLFAATILLEADPQAAPSVGDASLPLGGAGPDGTQLLGSSDLGSAPACRVEVDPLSLEGSDTTALAHRRRGRRDQGTRDDEPATLPDRQELERLLVEELQWLPGPLNRQLRARLGLLPRGRKWRGKAARTLAALWKELRHYRSRHRHDESEGKRLRAGSPVFDPELGVEVVVDLLMVKFDEATPLAVKQELATGVGGTLRAEEPGEWLSLIDLAKPRLKTLLKAHEALLEDPRVLDVWRSVIQEPSQLVPREGNDKEHGVWSTNPAGPSWGWEWIRLPQAWELTTGSPHVKIGVIERGFYVDHSDLRGNVARVRGELISAPEAKGVPVTPGGRDGYVVSGKVNTKFEREARFRSVYETWHGTATSGVIGARGNTPDVGEVSGGITGVNWRVGLHLYTAFDDSGFKAAVKQAVADGCRVINISYGLGWVIHNETPVAGDKVNEALMAKQRTFYNDVMKDLPADVLIVVSAGNDGLPAHWNGMFASAKPDYPDRILVVGASDDKGKIAEFHTVQGGPIKGWVAGSNYGPLVDLYAPGKNIRTLDSPGPGIKLNERTRTEFVSASGTSFSAPFAAGVCGLMLALDPSLTGPELKVRLLAAAEARGQKVVDRIGTTRYILDALGAVRSTWAGTRVADGDGDVDLALAADGTPHLVFSAGLEIRHAQRSDADWPSSLADVFDQGARRRPGEAIPRIAVDSRGVARLAYSYRAGSTPLLRLALQSGSAAKTWTVRPMAGKSGPPALFSTRPFATEAPYLAFWPKKQDLVMSGTDENHLAYLSYESVSNPAAHTSRRLLYRRGSEPAKVIDPRPGPGLFHGPPSLAVDREGTAHVTYVLERGSEDGVAITEPLRTRHLYYATITATGEITAINATPRYPHHVRYHDLAVDTEGNVHMVYCDDKGVIHHLTNVTGWSTRILASGEGRLPAPVQVEVDAAGVAHVAYAEWRKGVPAELATFHYRKICNLRRGPVAKQQIVLDDGDMQFGLGARMAVDDGGVAQFAVALGGAKGVRHIQRRLRTVGAP